jgi:hypothetical protein
MREARSVWSGARVTPLPVKRWVRCAGCGQEHKRYRNWRTIT